MNTFLNSLKETQNLTTTENGAEALKSTLNANLDMFGSFGAMRHSSEECIIKTFTAALSENRETAMRMLFYFRDIRCGQGTRRQFRVILTWLAEHHSELVLNNLDNIIYFGRGDDYLCLLDTSLCNDVIKYLMNKLSEDYLLYKEHKTCSLLAKWLPSENASSEKTREYAKKIISISGTPAKRYRKILSALRSYLKVVEVKMSASKWTDIDYEHVPAKASMNYSEAFYRHDKDGYSKYILDVSKGNASVNADSLYPVDIIHKVMKHLYDTNRKNSILDTALWNSLPNYFDDKEESSICVVDTSGSMYGTPLEVAVSLGMYCADKCNGPFKDHFITFSEHPELQYIKGSDIYEKVYSMYCGDWGCNTNLEAVFDMLLTTAIKNNCAPCDMPTKLYIISDMQFDQATSCNYKCYDVPFMQKMKKAYLENGYQMPSIVYWNVRASECGMFQSTFDGENCCMVSGYSPSLFKAIIEGTQYDTEETVVINKETGDKEVRVYTKQIIDPRIVMNTTVYNERYDCVWTS